MLTFDFDAGWDLVLKNTYGQPILSVEVKCKLNKESSWATQFRRNLLAHELAPITPYFLMALPDRFYLWTDSSAHQEDDDPDYIIDATSIFVPYVQRTGNPMETIGEYGLEMLLMSWFTEVMQPEAYADGRLAEYPWLIDSGLYAEFVGNAATIEVSA